jgi:NAD(P)-dependent dehydrogenase (short-subunit alcohol dehydrogenase family)
MTDPAHSGPILVEIRIGAWLEYSPAAKWFPGMSLRRRKNGETILRGSMPDQAALFGAFRRLQDLAIPLRSVTILPPAAGDVPRAACRRPEFQGDPSMNASNAIPNPPPSGESVLITGCSSGIGLATALYLAAHGVHVLAAVRKEPDAERLRGFRLAGLEPLCPLDMTQPAQIASAATAVKESLARRGREGLYAVVNNAGGGFISPLELMDLGRFRAEMETRVFGPVALLQELLPLVRRARGGRILWTATAGIVAIPNVASIHDCEFAMYGVAQTLHLELSPWNIPSIFIGCGGIRTAAVDRTEAELEVAMREWPREKLDLYARSLRKFQGQLHGFDAHRTEPEQVARTVYAALAAAKPKRKYLVGFQARPMSLLPLLPQSVLDGIFKRRV